MSDPRATGSGDPDDDRVRADVEAVAELAAFGVEVDGQAQVAESTWVVYGHTSYDGEIVVGEYQDAGEASEVLRAARDLDTGGAGGPGGAGDPDERPVR